MAMEITNNYSTYENIYATQKQQTEKKQAASGKETSETVDAQKNSKVGNDKTKSTADYAKKLEKTCAKCRISCRECLCICPKR